MKTCARIDSFATEVETLGRKKIPQSVVVEVTLTVRFEYPADMRPETAMAYAQSPAEWIRKYAQHQATREYHSHKD